MDSLTEQINMALAQFTANVNKNLDDTMKTTADDAKKMLKSTSPKKSGKYAKGWQVKKVNGTYTICNKVYYLTHLLENGHDVVAYGKKVGHAAAHPHIKKVEEWVQEEVPKRLEEKL